MLEATTSSESVDPASSDPPTGTGGGTTMTTSTADETIPTDPPEGSGGGTY